MVYISLLVWYVSRSSLWCISHYSCGVFLISRVVYFRLSIIMFLGTLNIKPRWRNMPTCCCRIDTAVFITWTLCRIRDVGLLLLNVKRGSQGSVRVSTFATNEPVLHVTCKCYIRMVTLDRFVYMSALVTTLASFGLNAYHGAPTELRRRMAAVYCRVLVCTTKTGFPGNGRVGYVI